MDPGGRRGGEKLEGMGEKKQKSAYIVWTKSIFNKRKKLKKKNLENLTFSIQ